MGYVGGARDCRVLLGRCRRGARGCLVMDLLWCWCWRVAGRRTEREGAGVGCVNSDVTGTDKHAGVMARMHDERNSGCHALFSCRKMTIVNNNDTENQSQANINSVKLHETGSGNHDGVNALMIAVCCQSSQHHHGAHDD